jgi:hypothetical protein
VLAAGAAAIPGRGVAIVALLGAHHHPVAALGLAAKARRRANPTVFHRRTVSRATVAVDRVAIVASLFARNAPVAANHG